MIGQRPAPSFLADALSLDFLNAVSPPPDQRYATLSSGQELLAWLEQANLAPHEVLKALGDKAAPGELDALLAQARALAEWFRGFVLKYKGEPLSAEAIGELESLNRILERDLRFRQVDIDEIGTAARKAPILVFRTERQWRSTDSLLLPLAQSTGELVCVEDFSNVRMCEGAGWTLLSLERTHGRGRRWCSMAVCGNRAKQAVRRSQQQDGFSADTC